MVLLSFHLSYLQAIIMGALQGVAELFPISSLGHSILVPAWLGGSWSDMVKSQDSTANSPFLAFIVALHVATAVALVIYYWRDWVQVVLGVVDMVRTRSLDSARSRLAALLIIATIPVGILGLIADKKLRHLFGSPRDAAIFLTINGVLLFVVERLARRAQRRSGDAQAAMSHGGSDAEDFASLGFGEATAIGASQALALLPGISRSGAAISAGLLRGLDHAKATHFAFLLATPVILGAGLLKVPELFKPENSGIHGQVIVGSIAAFIAAFIAVAFLARYMKTRTLYPFVAYCLVAGVVSIVHFA